MTFRRVEQSSRGRSNPRRVSYPCTHPSIHWFYLSDLRRPLRCPPATCPFIRERKIKQKRGERERERAREKKITSYLLSLFPAANLQGLQRHYGQHKMGIFATSNRVTQCVQREQRLLVIMLALCGGPPGGATSKQTSCERLEIVADSF